MAQDDVRNWRANFDARQIKEIEFSQVYAEQFGHGTDGHNAKLIIAKLVQQLDSLATGTGARSEQDAGYDEALEWAATWIEGSVIPGRDATQFAANMAMSIRAAKKSLRSA